MCLLRVFCVDDGQSARIACVSSVQMTACVKNLSSVALQNNCNLRMLFQTVCSAILLSRSYKKYIHPYSHELFRSSGPDIGLSGVQVTGQGSGIPTNRSHQTVRFYFSQNMQNSQFLYYNRPNMITGYIINIRWWISLVLKLSQYSNWHSWAQASFSASEMTYIVSSGALNSTNSLTQASHRLNPSLPFFNTWRVN